MELEELKVYLRIDHDDEDYLLQSFQKMAREYIKNAVGEVDKNNELYKFSEAILVGHWYENRELARIGNASYYIPDSFQSIIQQLRYCGDNS